MLRAIETAAIRQLKDDDFSVRFKALHESYLPLHANARGYSLDEERQKDITSHFILRLGFCRTEDTRRWFITHESLLFKFRYSHLLSNDEKLAFVCDELPELLTVSENEKTSLQKELFAATSVGTQMLDTYFKVPFESVSDLVARRAVFVKEGWAYVPRQDSLSILLTQFKAKLQKDLEETARILPRLNEDQRLLPVLLNLCSSTDLDDSKALGISSTGYALTAAQVESMATLFPPCMHHLHSQLKQESHLKHGGRMQYGLFLKSIGLSLDEAILYWKKAFSKKYTEDQFQKSYIYNIRHNYGQEGKRVNYAPYSCHKIITTNQPYAGDHHGCPFKHFGREALESYLTRLSAPGAKNFAEKALTPAAVREIMDLTGQHHYQIACTRLFEISRKLQAKNIETIAYPHQFFEWSKTTIPE